MNNRFCKHFVLLAAFLLLLPTLALTQNTDKPWMNKNLSPDERAEMVLKQMTLDEKIELLHGNGMPGWPGPEPTNFHFINGGAGMVMGIPRLGIPMIQMSDAAYGVRMSAANGRYSTALPSNRNDV